MSITFSELAPGHVAALSAHIDAVFDACVAPEFTPAGAQEFKRYSTPQSLGERLGSISRIFVAHRGDELVGSLEVRGGSHIAMFFVAGNWQRQGIGRKLLRWAVSQLRAQAPDLGALTVNASPNAMGAYEAYGFTPDSPEQEKNGIRFTPMTLAFKGAGAWVLEPEQDA
ncbi:GNAT family N-acetyltransferase [Desulfobaculum sp.]|jgi:GNAT superfamily N-acetyltransferase